MTPVYDGGHHHLLELYECLRAQEMPEGWDWEWIVQEDGTTGVPATGLPADERLSVSGGRAGGAAMARTVALARVGGVLTRSVDADDLLEPGSLRRDIEALTGQPGLAWCVSACVDLHPDGSRTPGPCDPPEGSLSEGILAEGHRAGHLQVMGTTLCAYTDLIRAVGGWQAIPHSDDVALLLACEAVSPGWMIAEVSEIYRKRAVQTFTDPEYMEPTEREARKQVQLARVDALRRSGWRWAPPEGALGHRPRSVEPAPHATGSGLAQWTGVDNRAADTSSLAPPRLTVETVRDYVARACEAPRPAALEEACQLDVTAVRCVVSDAAWMARAEGEAIPDHNHLLHGAGAVRAEPLVLMYFIGQRLRFDFRFASLERLVHTWHDRGGHPDALIESFQAFASLGLGKPDALEHYERCLAMDDVDSRSRHVCLTGMWAAYRVPGSAERLHELCSAMIDEGQANANVYFRRAAANRKRGRYYDALDDINTALELAPGDTEVNQDYLRERELIGLALSLSD